MGSYAIVLLVLPLASLTIAKFTCICQCERCFFFHLCAHTTYFSKILSTYSSTWTRLQFYETIVKLAVHAQAVDIPGRFSPPTWPGYEANFNSYSPFALIMASSHKHKLDLLPLSRKCVRSKKFKKYYRLHSVEFSSVTPV